MKEGPIYAVLGTQDLNTVNVTGEILVLNKNFPIIKQGFR